MEIETENNEGRETPSAETKQGPEKAEVEDRYKLTFLQTDKRLINLELALGELSEKIKGLKTVDAETINSIQERLDDLEDLIMVENLGEVELKKVLGDMNSKMAQVSELSKAPPGMSSEELQRFEASILQKVDEKFSNLPTIPSNQLTSLQEEITRLSERTRLLETEVIQKIVSEVADLRTEMSKEVRDVKDKLSGIGAIKPEIDIKFLSSRLNSLKESVEYMLNRKAELDMKMENLQKALAQVALKTEQLPVEKTSLEISSSIERRLDDIEEKVGFLADRIRSKEMEGGVKGQGTPVDLNMQINEILDKIVYLESRLRAVEKGMQKSEKVEPVILE